MSTFDKIESLLSQLILAASPVLSASEQSEIRRFVAVGEYGLALETAAAIYSEEKKVASPEVVELIKRLAIAMSVDPIPLLEMLPRQCA